MNVGFLRNAMMYLKGYKKQALRDTKGVLNKTNNHKWVKETKAATTTVLPNGTIVQDYYSIDGHKCKKVIKPDGKMFFSRRALKDSEYVTPMKGFDNISVHEGVYNFGTTRRPCYMPKTTIEVLKSKSAEEALAEQAKIKESIQVDKTRQRRLKFIERFNQKYDRVSVKNPDGSRRKCVIDKKSGDEVWVWEKDPNGRTTTSEVLDLGGYKEVISSSSDGSYNVTTTTQMPSGRKVTQSFEIK